MILLFNHFNSLLTISGTLALSLSRFLFCDHEQLIYCEILSSGLLVKLILASGNGIGQEEYMLTSAPVSGKAVTFRGKLEYNNKQR